MKRWGWVGIAVFPWIAALTPVPNQAKTTLLITGDFNGYLSPCGCVKPMQGGIRRLGAAVAAERVQGEAPLLVNGRLSGGLTRQDELKLETLGEALRAMGAHAINLSSEDARLGEGAILSLSRLSGRRVLASNLSEANALNLQSGLEVAGHWVVGISSRATSLASSVREQVAPLDDRFSAAGKRPIIVLLDGDRRAAEALAKGRENLHLIVYSSAGSPPSKPERVNNTWLVTPGEKGKQYLRISFDSKRALEYQVVPLGPEVENDPHVTRVFEGYLGRVTGEKLMEAMPRSKGHDFAGSKTCGTCHSEDYKVWVATSHAKALATLEAEKQDRDPECISCHVVGVDQIAGFRDRKSTPDLAEVGCESCHGAGKAHSLAPMQNAMPKIDEKSCNSCHVPAHSPGFDYLTYWPKIAHGGEK